MSLKMGENRLKPAVVLHSSRKQDRKPTLPSYRCLSFYTTCLQVGIQVFSIAITSAEFYLIMNVCQEEHSE
jgi:hypothetical protein